MPDVFLSYNREDQAIARRFAEAFEAQGLNVWWDTALRAGEAYDQVTEKALREAKAVVVLWSKKSVESRWVRAEATLADRNKTLVPCMIEPCERPIMFELTQTAELSHWQGDASDRAWVAFFEDVRRFVGTERKTVSFILPTTSAPALPDKPSIAVLPFTDMTGGTDRDYFTEGVVDEINTALSRFSSLFVIGNSSTLAYGGEARNLKRIAAELGVRYLLEGSVRKAADRVRISTKLTDAVEGTQIWTERFDGTVVDVFALQDEVANAVASQIEPSIQAAETRRAHSRPTHDIGAYELYLRALQLQRGFNAEDVAASVTLLEKAVAADPGYGLAHALLAFCRALQFYYWSGNSEETRALARASGVRALKHGDDDAQVLAWVALSIGVTGDDIEFAEKTIERALGRNRGSAYLWYVSGWVKLWSGRSEEALAHLEKTMRLDPRSPDRPEILAGMGWSLFFLRRFDDALPVLKEALQLRPSHQGPLQALAAAYAHLDRLAEAREAYRRLEIPDELVDIYRTDEQRRLIRSGLSLARTGA